MERLPKEIAGMKVRQLQEKTPYILAGTYREYTNYLQEIGVKAGNNKYVYIHSIRDLHGLSPKEVKIMRVGQYWQRTDYHDILRYAVSQGYTVL